MKNHHIYLILRPLLLVLALALTVTAQEIPKAKPEDVGMSSPRLQTLSATLDGYVKNERLAGGVALVLRRGKVAYLHAFGERDRESKSAMKPDAIFRIASQSKALTSVAIMMLQEEGKLTIGDPVSKFIPEFANSTVAVPKDGGGYDIVKAKRQITLRDLLTHTSGASYGGGPARDKWQEAKVNSFYFSDKDNRSARPSDGWQVYRWTLIRASGISMAIRPTFSAAWSSERAA